MHRRRNSIGGQSNDITATSILVFSSSQSWVPEGDEASSAKVSFVPVDIFSLPSTTESSTWMKPRRRWGWPTRSWSVSPALNRRVRGAPSGAKCRQCQALIAQGAWRIRLSTFGETGFFDPLGFIHASCARDYFEMPSVPSVKERLLQAAPDLDPSALDG